jgi:transcription elongation factor GreB
MSKAFTKESDGDNDDESELPSLQVPGGKNYITPHGHQRLLDELNKYLYGERPEVVRVVSWAASNGDRSENADYIYGKRRLREIDRKIRFLSKRIEIAEIVNPLEKSGHLILFGATVDLQGEDGRKRTYAIVGVDETDASKGRISWISPMGKALLQTRKGDAITVRTPKGDEEFEILDVRYEELK